MLNKIDEIISSCETFLITSHIRLDGDALGSELAFYHALNDMGKKVTIYNQDNTPEIYGFLPGSEVIVHSLSSIEEFDAVFVLDCSGIERLGREADRIGSIKKIVNIDHHISNSGFSDISLIDPSASSTGEIIQRLLKELDLPLTKDIATNIYTAILTDTGSFHYSNTSNETFRSAAELVENGADSRLIAEKVYENKNLLQIKLMECTLRTLDFDCDGRVGSVYMTRRMFEETGALDEHAEGLVDMVRSIKGVEVAASCHEISKETFKISLRSKGNINIESVAGTFGGGGHINASACVIEGDIKTVKDKLTNAIKAVLCN